jgi:2-methylisocitrate lyase-like PEP mutase family enzyme
MARRSQRQLAEDFRGLHRTRPLLIPNAWDAMSAKTFEAVGFKAVATTSGGIAWSLGYQDGERAPWSEVVGATRRIARVLDGPLTADIEAGYATTLDQLHDHTVDIINAGAVGLNIEDQSAGCLRDIADATTRIAAVRKAADDSDVPIFINARTDVFHIKDEPKNGRIVEVLRRARAYHDAGADGIFLFGLADMQVAAELIAKIDLPVNIVGRAGLPNLSALAKIGVGRVTMASSLALHAFGCTHRVAHALFDTGEFALPDGSMTRAAAQAFFPLVSENDG